jgi:hypothetical protein
MTAERVRSIVRGAFALAPWSESRRREEEERAVVLWELLSRGPPDGDQRLRRRFDLLRDQTLAWLNVLERLVSWLAVAEDAPSLPQVSYARPEPLRWAGIATRGGAPRAQPRPQRTLHCAYCGRKGPVDVPQGGQQSASAGEGQGSMRVRRGCTVVCTACKRKQVVSEDAAGQGDGAAHLGLPLLELPDRRRGLGFP